MSRRPQLPVAHDRVQPVLDAHALLRLEVPELGELRREPAGWYAGEHFLGYRPYAAIATLNGIRAGVQIAGGARCPAPVA